MLTVTESAGPSVADSSKCMMNLLVQGRTKALGTAKAGQTATALIF